jgi:hypothetical protein
MKDRDGVRDVFFKRRLCFSKPISGFSCFPFLIGCCTPTLTCILKVFVSVSACYQALSRLHPRRLRQQAESIIVTDCRLLVVFVVSTLC